MSNARTVTVSATEQSEAGSKPHQVVGSSDVQEMLDRYQFTTEARRIIEAEKLLPVGLLSRLQASYPQHSGLLENKPFLFKIGTNYTGLEGFRQRRPSVDNALQIGIDLSEINRICTGFCIV